jgi:hypothetical protein
MAAMLANAPERAYVLEPEWRIEGAQHRQARRQAVTEHEQPPTPDRENLVGLRFLIGPDQPRLRTADCHPSRPDAGGVVALR